MLGNYEITSKGSSGESKKLIFSESIEMLDKNDILTITLPKDEANGWRLIIGFIDDDNEKEFGGRTEYSPNSITILLNKWYSDTWVQSTKPMVFSSKDNKLTLEVVIKTMCSKMKGNRLLILSIWQTRT